MTQTQLGDVESVTTVLRLYHKVLLAQSVAQTNEYQKSPKVLVFPQSPHLSFLQSL